MKSKLKFVYYVGLLAAITMIIVGFAIKLPEKYVYVSSSSSAYNYGWERNTGAEYVGGDCYNLQMEASLKAGYMAGLMTEKAICVVGGVLLLFLSLFGMARNNSSVAAGNELLEAIKANAMAQNDSSRGISNELMQAIKTKAPAFAPETTTEAPVFPMNEEENEDTNEVAAEPFGETAEETNAEIPGEE